MLDDIVNNYSNVVIGEDSFKSEQWSVSIEDFKQDEYEYLKIPFYRNCENYEYILKLIKREKYYGE